MNTPSTNFRTRSPLALLRMAVLLPVFAGTLGAADYYWDANRNSSGTGGTGTWSTSGNRWRLGSVSGSLRSWGSGSHTADRAIFGGTAGTVSIGNGISTHGMLFSTSGYLLQSGTITLTGVNPTITVDGTSTSFATIGSVLAGANLNVIKDGAGVLTLTAANTYTGTTTVNAGTLRLGGTTDLDFINRGSALTLNNGTIDFANFIEDTGVFTLNGGIITGGSSAALGVLTSSSTAASAFDVRNGTADVILSNPFGSLNGAAASVGLTKSTNGIVTLTRANTYTGATRILGGTLVLNGSIASQSSVTVAAGATFAGTGTTNNATVTVNGRLAPGAMSVSGVSSIGTLSTGAEIWNGGGSYSWQISNATGVAGTGWDLLELGGALTINATAANPFRLELIGLGANGLPGAIAGFDNTQGFVWTLLTTSAISGLSVDNVVLDTVGFTANNALAGGHFSLSQNGGALNLVFTPVPEPSVYALALGLGTLGFVGVRQWRRRRVQFA